MVLAIGLLVDDAIVVVENVERLMAEENLTPQEATLRSMNEITGALIGIALVLSTVFIPMAFFGGSVGIIYRQFTVTIVSAMALSALVALTLTPTLCAHLLKPGHINKGRFFILFNRGVAISQNSYLATLRRMTAHPLRFVCLALILTFLMLWQYQKLASGFLPEEDQGAVMVQYSLPSGSPMSMTEAVGADITHYFMTEEKDNLDVIFMVTGRNNAGSGQNVGMAFAELKHWDQRPGKENSAQAIILRANQYFNNNARQANISVMSPPTIRGLGQSSGFELWLQDSAENGSAALMQAQTTLLNAARENPALNAVRINSLEEKAQLQVDVDRQKAQVQGWIRPISTIRFQRPGGAYMLTTLSIEGGLNACISRETRPGVQHRKIYPPGLSVATATTWRPSTASRRFAGPADRRCFSVSMGCRPCSFKEVLCLASAPAWQWLKCPKWPAR
ncbi:putative rnd superfamily protein [Klebsiella aerogenes]|nr:putative rnd superfamily protein [Klebsiella aerogenes]